MVCAALVPAGLALAGYQEGSYLGKTGQKQSLSFRATSEKVKRLATLVYADCESGPRREITVQEGRTKIEGGRFSLELKGDIEEVSIVGRISDAQASGRIRAVVKPPGTTCTAETGWNATLAAAATKP